jgi:hypothetical protein
VLIEGGIRFIFNTKIEMRGVDELMMIRVKRMISIGLLMSLIFYSSSVFARSDVEFFNDEPASIILQHIEALNNHDWDKYISFEPTEAQQITRAFIENTVYRNQFLGIHNVESVSLHEIKELPNDFVAGLTNFSYYTDKYHEIHSYLVGMNFKVKKEDKYFYNGVNYRLMIVGKEQGEWKILENSIAPIVTISQMGYGFGSKEEKAAIFVAQQRAKGKIVNAKGELLEESLAEEYPLHTPDSVPSKLTTEEELYLQEKERKKNNAVDSASGDVIITPQDVSPYRPSDQHLPPSRIRVFRVKHNRIDTPTLYDYVRGVLPNEWILYDNPKMESLKAGAMVTKFVGWYRVWASPKYPNLAYDVRDDTADQVYNPESGKETTHTLSAINAVEGIGIMNSSGNIFYTEYKAGTKGQPGPYHGGELKQYGADYLNDQGYNWMEILHYYYDQSNKSIGDISPFFYTSTSWTAGDSLTYYSTVYGQKEWWFKVTGQNRSVDIETVPYGPETDTYLELYDANLRLLRYDDDSGGGNYSRISSYYMGSGTYYIKVRSYNGTSPVYCGIYLSAATPQTITTLGYPNGGTSYNYFITGDGRPTSFETLPYGTLTDTVLELYNSNGQLIASDDDYGTGAYSLISKVVLNPGQVYRLHVRNYHVNSPVYCQVIMIR